MENTRHQENNRLHKWLISGLISVMLACSSLSTPIEKLPDITPDTAHGTNQNTTNEPGASSVPGNDNQIVDLILFELTVQPSENGWTPYEAKIAIQNKGLSSIFLAEEDNDSSMYGGHFTPNLQTIHIYSDKSQIITSEGNQYPVDYISTGPSVVIIPGGFTISSGRRWNLVDVYFRVPELLHPIQLVISPGVVYEGGVPVINIVDIVDNIQKPLSPLSALALENLPANIQVGDKIHLNIGFPLTPSIRYAMDEFYLSIPFNLQNEDITRDQPVELEYLIVDDSGQIFSGDELPFTIGPGQTVTTPINFVLPPSETFGPHKLYLKTINNYIDNTYNIQIPNLTNCVYVETPVDIYGTPIHPAETVNEYINVPGSILGQTERYIEHRIFFDGAVGDLISIEVESDVDDYFYFELTDPSGIGIVGGHRHPDGTWENSGYVGNWISSLSRIPIVCNEKYSLYFSFTGDPEGATNYKVTINRIESP